MAVFIEIGPDYRHGHIDGQPITIAVDGRDITVTMGGRVWSMMTDSIDPLSAPVATSRYVRHAVTCAALAWCAEDLVQSPPPRPPAGP